MTLPGQDAAPERQGWRRRAYGMVAERLGLKATALGLSVLLWFLVHVIRVVGVTP